MGSLEANLWLANQAVGLLGALSCTALATGLSRWVWRRGRFPHAAAWLIFLLWSVAVAAVPALAQLDQSSAAFYSLRGLTWGLLLASMLSLSPRKVPAGEGEVASDPP